MPTSGACSTVRRTAATPARCPAARDSPCLVAQRPLPSMMMATCSLRSGKPCTAEPLCKLNLLCIVKFLAQKKLSPRRRQILHRICRHFALGAARCVLHHLLQRFEIVEIALAPVRGNAAHRQRTIFLRALHNLNQVRALQHLQVPAQVAVGQRAKLLQVGKAQAARIGDQRREDAQPRALVDGAIQPLIREPSLICCAPGLHTLPSFALTVRMTATSNWPSPYGTPMAHGEKARLSASPRQVSPVSRYQRPATTMSRGKKRVDENTPR